MEKVDRICWPAGRSGDLLAVRLELPSPCTLNQTSLVLADQTVAVFLPRGREPIVLREGTNDLSFEIDGFMAGLAQLFYSKPYEGSVWLVQAGGREVAWSVEVDGVAVSGTLWFCVLDHAGLVASCGDDEVSWEGLSEWARKTWEHAYVPVARAAQHDWEDAATEAEARCEAEFASRGLKMTIRDEIEAGDAAPGEEAPTAEECLLGAMALVGQLADTGAIVFADGMVSEQASVALADRLLAEGCRVDEEGAERIWAILQELPGVLLTIAYDDFVDRVEQVEA